MFKCKNKIWLENITELFCCLNIVPLEGMTLESQLNSLSRLVIMIFMILYLLNVKFSYLFLLLSLLFIIILYYIQRYNMEQFKSEHFTETNCGKSNALATTSRTFCNQQGQLQSQHFAKNNYTKSDPLFQNTTSQRFCNDQKSLNYNNPNYMSANQRLVGKPNPKTLIPPVIVPPPADLGFWKANNLIKHSAINTASQIDITRSGYKVQTKCGDLQNTYLVPTDLCETQENSDEKVQENFQMPYLKQVPLGNHSGQVNTSCGYNPEQLEVAGLPTNYPAGNCEKNPLMKKYNDNLYTNTLQPNVYTRNQINEPINSNIGISFTQQIPPITCKNTKDGGVIFTEHDPRIIEPVEEGKNMNVINDINVSNVYDPRHTGYGTSYRAYTDDNIGQTRFFYDDVNAIKMPNYITRSKIDFASFADTYGPKKEGEQFGNLNNSTIRALANDQFLRSTIEQRTDLQESLMRKFNTRYSQQRSAPIRTGGQYMLGGKQC